MPMVAGRRGRAARLYGRPETPLAPLCSPRAWATWSKADRRGDLYPAKARPERKTDAAVAMLMAIGPAMAEDEGAATDLDAFLAHPVFA